MKKFFLITIFLLTYFFIFAANSDAWTCGTCPAGYYCGFDNLQCCEVGGCECVCGSCDPCDGGCGDSCPSNCCASGTTPTPTPTPIPRSLSGRVYCQDPNDQIYPLPNIVMTIIRNSLGDTEVNTSANGTFTTDLTEETGFAVRIEDPLPAGQLDTGMPYSELGTHSLNSKDYCDAVVNDGNYEMCDPEATTNHVNFDFIFSQCSHPPEAINLQSSSNSVCLINNNSVTFEATYSDPDDPSIDNHMVNGDFESGSNNWNLYNPSGGSYNFTPSDTYGGSGAVEMNIGTSGDRNMSVYQGRYAGQNDYSDDPSQWAGKTIYFSFYYKLSADAQINLQVSPTTSAGVDTWWSPEGILILSSPINEWTKAEKAVTFPEQIDGLDILGFDVSLLANTGNPSDPVTVWVDDITITDAEEQVFTDIHDFQFNLETEYNSALSRALWPLRLMFNRKDGYRDLPANSFAVDSGTNIGDSIGEYATAIYDELKDSWYLPTDLPLKYNDEDGVTIATLKGGAEGSDYNTWFAVEDNDITTSWTVEFNSNFPADTYNANLYVRDMHGMQDSIAPTGVGESMLTLDGPLYFHRLDTLEFFSPVATGNFYLDPDATMMFSCSGSEDDPITLTGANIKVENTNQTINANNYSVTPNDCTEDNLYDVTLTIPNTSGYACACPDGISNPLICTYPDADINDPINFYLELVDLNNDAWFQTVGGSIQAAGPIISFVPYNDEDGPCLTIVDCWPSLIAGSPFSEVITYSPGFAISSNENIDTDEEGGNQDGLIHYNPDRTFENPPDDPISQAADGNAPSVTLNTTQENYDYFYNKFGAEYDILVNELSNANMPAGLSLDTLEVLFYRSGDLTIDETTVDKWDIADGQKVVVFVGDGITTDYNLTISGGAGDDTTIIEVAEGGFLAFIVSGNITIDEAVGHDMDSIGYDTATFLPTNVNTNIEGVFIADGTFDIESNGDADTRDRKFIGAGTFVGWGGVNLRRDFDDGILGNALHNVQATETFIHRPDFLLSMPIEMKVATHEWRQVPAAIE